MNRITSWFNWFFTGKIPTTKKALEMGLTHERNIYGDEINITGCRSFWKDKYGRRFGCEELLQVNQNVPIEVLSDFNNNNLDYKTLKYIKNVFIIQNDKSTSCYGYTALCSIIEEYEKLQIKLKDPKDCRHHDEFVKVFSNDKSGYMFHCKSCNKVW